MRPSVIQIKKPVLCGKNNSYQRRIQDFAGGGEGAATYYSPNFPENCMEIKELELSLGARPRFVYVDLQLRYCFCRNTL